MTLRTLARMSHLPHFPSVFPLPSTLPVLSSLSPASCSLDELFASRLARIGRPYRTWNCFSLPRNPGNRKSKSDHSSRTLFWMGVPERMRRWRQLSCFTARDNWTDKARHMVTNMWRRPKHSHVRLQVGTVYLCQQVFKYKPT